MAQPASSLFFNASLSLLYPHRNAFVTATSVRLHANLILPRLPPDDHVDVVCLICSIYIYNIYIITRDMFPRDYISFLLHPRVFYRPAVLCAFSRPGVTPPFVEMNPPEPELYLQGGIISFSEIPVSSNYISLIHITVLVATMIIKWGIVTVVPVCIFNIRGCISSSPDALIILMHSILETRI